MLKKPLWQISFLQALGVTSYVGLVALFMWNAERLFGQMNTFTGPMIGLMLFSISVLVCALLVFSFPFLFWSDQKPKKALEIVAYTAAWLSGFGVVLLVLLLAK